MAKPQKGRRMPPPSEIKLGTKIKQHADDYVPELGLCASCGGCFEEFDLVDGLCPDCWCELEM